MHFRSGGVDPGRDGCRVPLPWSGTTAAVRLQSRRAPRPSRGSASPPHWADLTVEAQEADPDSMLHLYRAALAIRRAEPGLGDGPMTWLDAPDDVLAFARGELVCVVNLGGEPVALPEHRVRPARQRPARRRSAAARHRRLAADHRTRVTRPHHLPTPPARRPQKRTATRHPAGRTTEGVDDEVPTQDHRVGQGRCALDRPLAACSGGSSGDSTSASGGKVTITVAGLLPGADRRCEAALDRARHSVRGEVPEHHGRAAGLQLARARPSPRSSPVARCRTSSRSR